MTLCGIGRMTHVCLEAAERLAAEGIEAEVVDVLTPGPARRGDDPRVGRAHPAAGRRRRGHADRLDGARHRRPRRPTRGFDYLDAPIKTVTAPDTPVPFSAALERHYVPGPDQVVRAVHEQLGVE